MYQTEIEVKVDLVIWFKKIFSIILNDLNDNFSVYGDIKLFSRHHIFNRGVSWSGDLILRAEQARSQLTMWPWVCSFPALQVSVLLWGLCTRYSKCIWGWNIPDVCEAKPESKCICIDCCLVLFCRSVDLWTFMKCVHNQFIELKSHQKVLISNN